ncbi:PRP3-domain-containing protein [Martensiomyces pterosporus]|nr:PRP3-domain-containing protein [Martensiomyces pterosporus]
MAQQNQDEVSALIAKKRAEVLARIAKMNLPSGNASVHPPPQLQASLPAVPSPAATAGTAPSLQETIAATRARIEARMRSQGLAKASQPPSSQPSSQPSPAAQPPTTSTGTAELHPMLRDDFKPFSSGKGKPGQVAIPRISSIKANQRKPPQKRMKIEHEIPASFADPEKNPYFDPFLGGQRSAEPRQRKHGKQFQFVRPGRYVEQADKLRAEARLEKLKAEIEERAAKAKLEDEVLDVSAIRPAEPPEVEWWDAPFLVGNAYDLVPDKAKLEGPDSLVTIYVQHPVPIEPPEPICNASSAPSQLILTKKERKKVRRQRRLEQQREHREKVMLGLLPPDPPKLRLSNFMRILANQSVPDPTRLEAEVRRQVQARQSKHEADNQARKLTKEQRREKIEAKMEAEEKKGLVCAVFRVSNLTHPQHRYKVSINAKQHNLTGVALACPQMSLVIAEGSAKAVKAYKKLMLRRIDWTDSQPKLESHSGTAAGSSEHEQGEEEGAQADYSDNECHLVWQGELDERRFKFFKLRVCPTESQAKSWLASAKCDSFWQLAKQYSSSDSITALNQLV